MSFSESKNVTPRFQPETQPQAGTPRIPAHQIGVMAGPVHAAIGNVRRVVVDDQRKGDGAKVCAGHEAVPAPHEPREARFTGLMLGGRSGGPGLG